MRDTPAYPTTANPWAEDVKSDEFETAAVAAASWSRSTPRFSEDAVGGGVEEDDEEALEADVGQFVIEDDDEQDSAVQNSNGMPCSLSSFSIQ